MRIAHGVPSSPCCFGNAAAFDRGVYQRKRLPAAAARPAARSRITAATNNTETDVPIPSRNKRSSRFDALIARAGMAALFAAALPYVPNQKSGTISVIDTATDTVTKTLSGGGALGKRLQAIDSDVKGDVLYVVDAEHNTLVAIDPASDSVKHSVDIGEDAEGVRLSPSGDLLALVVSIANTDSFRFRLSEGAP